MLTSLSRCVLPFVYSCVQVTDVARAVLQCVRDGNTAGKVYELTGPKVYTRRELMQIILDVTGLWRTSLLSVPAIAAMCVPPQSLAFFHSIQFTMNLLLSRAAALTWSERVLTGAVCAGCPALRWR